MTELFCIQNRLSTLALRCQPWLLVAPIPDEAKQDKTAFDKWAKAKATKHCFYTGFEGCNPAHRVNRENKPVLMHALVADYDIAGGKHITRAEIDSIRDSLPEHLLPTWAHSTFSGGARLVWLFEKPVSVELDAFRKIFVEHLLKVLKLDKLLPGLDTNALTDYAKTYDVWCEEWLKMGEPIPASLVEQWQFECGDKLRFRLSDLSGEEIPLDKVSEEAERRFPGRWSGPFEPGKRGIVFFDPSSVNPTAAIVTEKGMICFGQAKTFYSWADIFGAKFVDSFIQDRVGAVVKDIYYDSLSYWAEDGTGRWSPSNKETLTLKLRALGLDDETPKNGMSQVDKALFHINEYKRVDRVAPLVYVRERFLIDNGYRTLNISHVQPMAPADQAGEWGENFSWLAEYLSSALGEEQLPYFLAWFQWYYRGAYTGTPNKGHALFFAGPAETGKTFLSNRVIATAMGGHYPATKFLLGETQFNKGPSEAPLWTVDDGTPAQQDSMLNKFSERMKQLVVNGSFEVRAMRRDGVDINWSGRRLMITLNDDPVSIRMLPPLDTSNEDKLMFFKMHKPTCGFYQDPAMNDQRVRAELPFLLRWLLNWSPPEHVLDPYSRLAVVPWVHPELRVGSMAANGGAELLQVIDMWFNRRRDENEKSDQWEGRSAELLSSFDQDDALKILIRKEDARSIGRKLGMLASNSQTCGRVQKIDGQNGAASCWRLIAPWVERKTPDIV